MADGSMVWKTSSEELLSTVKSLLEPGAMSLLPGKSISDEELAWSGVAGLLLEESSVQAARNAAESAMTGRIETLFFIYASVGVLIFLSNIYKYGASVYAVNVI